MSAIPVLARGSGWLAVAKPGGITMHNRAGHDLLSQVAREQQAEDLHAIHRLDAGTSGVVLLATDKNVATKLHEQFAGREVTKEYLAIARASSGAIPRPGDAGLWKAALTKKAESRRNPQGWAGMRVPCRTEWEVLAVEGEKLVLLCRPLTGRKHQIRRHAALVGWPLIGDFRYGPPPPDRDPRAQEEEGRLSLHAWRLAFRDPTTDERVQVVAPPPADLAIDEALLARLTD